MTKFKILATGLSGMVGSTIKDILKDRVLFEDLIVDITDAKTVSERISYSDSPYVVHFAAKANPDECEKDKEEMTKLPFGKESGKDLLHIDKIQPDQWKGLLSAFAVNVVGTKNISEACKKAGKKLIHISTDYVFSGRTKDKYIEKSLPDPVNYYGLTKYWGELVVQHVLPESTIMRIAVPFGAISSTRPDVVSRMRHLLQSNGKVQAVEDQLTTPTLINDIVEALVLILSKDVSGTFHVVGSQTLSPFELALAIAEIFNYDKHLIMPVSFKTYYINRAPRPQFLTLSNDKLRELGFTPLSFKEGLSKIKKSL
jgi:dTDP-4-dehydrorhamnose reductase